ncbi:hypothetical protein [Nannocystis punicea]|uniref:Uncharacterized protein n=1 Tax=Nannocystis punicea TaxID=2995304 RepID=A0ABY7H9L2_9BACT|nr:hypothetical protein [Nannocystis poenicansa]WAS95792.1 hypothetical protein O0S08_06480 [Nannocystis poenicansa]
MRDAAGAVDPTGAARPHGIDLGGITTCSTLQRGVALALAAGR